MRVFNNRKNTFLLGFAYFNLFSACQLHAAREWAWQYVHELKEKDRAAAFSQSVFTTSNDAIEPFTQLLFSWNAQRPAKGYFVFFVQGRDAHAGMWSSWHEAMKWGNGVQESFMRPSDGVALYAHVRFEADAGKKCDAYRLRVKAYEGADLRALRRLAVTCADFTQFTPEAVHAVASLPAVYIQDVPCYSQFCVDHPENKRICSPTSTAILVEFITKKRYALSQMAQKIFDCTLDTYGNWAFNMAHAYELSDKKAYYKVARLNSFKDLHSYLMRGFPVAVSVRGTLKGAPQAYASGHLLVVVGYDPAKKEVICHDPAFLQDHITEHAYDLGSFLRAWECSRRLAYCIDTSFDV